MDHTIAQKINRAIRAGIENRSSNDLIGHFQLKSSCRSNESPCLYRDDTRIIKYRLTSQNRSHHHTMERPSDIRAELMTIQQLFLPKLVTRFHVDQRKVGVETDVDDAFVWDGVTLGHICRCQYGDLRER